MSGIGWKYSDGTCHVPYVSKYGTGRPWDDIRRDEGRERESFRFVKGSTRTTRTRPEGSPNVPRDVSAIRHANRCFRAYLNDVDAIRERKRNARDRERMETANDAPAIPLLLLRNDVREGRIPRASAIVRGERRVDVGDRHYVTYMEEAMGYLVQLERLYGDYVSVRRVSEATMRHATTREIVKRPDKRSRGTATLYLTSADLQRIADEAIGGYVEVVGENRNGTTCVRYFRNRHSRVHGIVRRHLREAGSPEA